MEKTIQEQLLKAVAIGAAYEYEIEHDDESDTPDRLFSSLDKYIKENGISVDEMDKALRESNLEKVLKERE